MPEVTDIITFSGHPNIRATHRTTLEVTRAPYLSKAGDCIIGVMADKACSNLQHELQKILKTDNSVVEAVIEVKEESFRMVGRGSGSLTLRSKDDVVFRTSAFTCTRTVAIKCNASAADLPRHMVELLRDPRTKGRLIISATL